MLPKINKVINPLTGRWISIGSDTYNKLLKKGVNSNKNKIKKSLKSSKRSKDNITKKQENDIYKLNIDTNIKKNVSSQTKGWGKAAPKRGKERNILYDTCGPSCFLIPKDKSFPICKLVEKKKDCKIDCRGLASAKVRAGEWKYDNILKFSKKLYNDKCDNNSNCKKYKKTVKPKCNDQPNCNWKPKTGCIDKYVDNKIKKSTTNKIKKGNTNKIKKDNTNCNNFKKTKNPKCNEQPKCIWVPRKGCLPKTKENIYLS